MRMEDGGWRMEDGRWRMEDGGGRREMGICVGVSGNCGPADPDFRYDSSSEVRDHDVTS